MRAVQKWTVLVFAMEPLIKEKKEMAVFVPYRKQAEDGVFEYYLQKRDGNAPVHANIFSLFGGAIEDRENVTAALLREVQEELTYQPSDEKYFCKFETSRAVFYVYIEEVGADFEARVVVNEGEFGKFLTYAMVDHSHHVSDIAEMVVRALNEYLAK